MSNMAAGFECPGCGSMGDHAIMYFMAGIAIRLHCLTCEESFECVLD